MRIATITNWAYGATVLLTMVSGGVTLLASGAEQRERAAVEQRAQFDALSTAAEEDSYRLTEQARHYVITGDPAHLLVHDREVSQLGSIEGRLRKLNDAGATPSELAALRDALKWADALVDEQRAAIAARRVGRDDEARQILFGAEYERELDRVDGQISRFQYQLDQRTELAVQQATESSRWLRSVSEVMLGITALMFLCVLYFILKQRILRPVVRLSDVVTRLAAQDFDAAPPKFHHIDEIGDMAQAIRIFRENGLERLRLEKGRDADRAMRDLLSRLTQRLQGCDSVIDLVEVVRCFAPEIAPSFAGRLYINDIRRNSMTQACEWLAPQHSRNEFPPTACWAVRRGQIHRPHGEMIDIPCEHLDGPATGNPVCVPLTAQGETLALLYFEERDGMEADQRAAAETYMEMLAENIGLALANLRLRDRLRDLAMADPLTGLPNRRQFDTVLERTTADAERNATSLACLMVDIDHFKRFNDENGHDAGDAVLRAVAEVLSSSTREDGFAFRYGGEEFVLLMPGFDTMAAIGRAEQIRARIAALSVDYHDVPLGTVTASIGIAAAPEHVRSQGLLRAADAALLRAKAEGRNRTLAATPRETRSAA